MLEVTDVHKSYGSHDVLHGVRMEISAGEIVALLGANGAGKTTLLSIVSGLRRADRGSVRIAGKDSTDPATRRLLGVAPQTLGVYPTMAVHQNLELFGRLAGLRGRDLRRCVEWTAHELGLSELLGRRAGELSGGQQRRLHTAMALVGRPGLLLLDEPTVGADVASRAQILDVVRSVARSGCAVCYTTHHLAEIEDLEANLAILRGGRIVAAGTRQQVAESIPGCDEGARGDGIEMIYDHFVGEEATQPVGPRELESGNEDPMAANDPEVRDVA